MFILYFFAVLLFHVTLGKYAKIINVKSIYINKKIKA